MKLNKILGCPTTDTVIFLCLLLKEVCIGITVAKLICA